MKMNRLGVRGLPFTTFAKRKCIRFEDVLSRNLQTTLLFPLLCLINIQIRKRRAHVALSQIDPIYHSGVNSFVSAFFASFHFPPFAFQTAKVQPTHRARAKSSLRALSANNHFVAPRVPDHLVPPRSLLKTCNNSLDICIP